MNLEEYKGVFVFAQQVDNKLNGIALELVGKGKDLAKDLGTEVTAVLIGSDVMSLTKELAEYGADRIIVVDDPELKEYRTEPYAHALAEVIKKYKPEILSLIHISEPTRRTPISYAVFCLKKKKKKTPKKKKKKTDKKTQDNQKTQIKLL